MDRNREIASRTKRIGIALTACLGLALAFSAPAPAAKHGKKVIGKTSYYVEQSPTSFLDPAFVKSKRVRHPKKGSLSGKVTGANEDPAFDNQIYVSGLIQCVKHGQRYALGKVYYQQQSPFVLRKIPSPTASGSRRAASSRCLRASTRRIRRSSGTRGPTA